MPTPHSRLLFLLLALLCLFPAVGEAQPFWPDPDDYYPDAPEPDDSDADWPDPPPTWTPPSTFAPAPTAPPAYAPLHRWSAPPADEELDINATLEGEYNPDTGRATVTLRFDIENPGRESRDAHEVEVWLRDQTGRLLTHARAAPAPTSVPPGARRTSSQTILSFSCAEGQSLGSCLQELDKSEFDIWSASKRRVVHTEDDEY